VTSLLDSARLALQAIWTHKLRSLMTVLGNVVAVTSIVAVVSLIQGVNAQVSSAIVSNVGADSFTIQRLPPIRTADDEERTRSHPLITLDELRAVSRAGPSVVAAMAQAQRTATVSWRDRELTGVRVQGVTSDYAEFSMFDAGRGRMMSVVEVDRGRPVVLLGPDVAAQLFGDLDPIERSIAIEGVRFRVLGVSTPRGGVFGQSQDAFAVIPLGAYSRLFGARQSLALMVKPASPDRLQDAMDEAVVALRVHRKLRPDAADNFGFFTSDTFMGLYQQATTGLFAVLVGVVGLALVVGGIVIMNIMLMVVSERTREIGLRRALGARRSHILAQVLTESVTLSTLGGLVGVFLGFLVALAIAAVSPLPARIEPWSVALGVGITAAVGLLFGLYPARQAARLDPIEALRRE
jgi:putative ABC transport system permease protein